MTPPALAVGGVIASTVPFLFGDPAEPFVDAGVLLLEQLPDPPFNPFLPPLRLRAASHQTSARRAGL